MARAFSPKEMKNLEDNEGRDHRCKGRAPRKDAFWPIRWYTNQISEPYASISETCRHKPIRDKTIS